MYKRQGVKCIDVTEAFIVTGSYDCTAKVWRRDNWLQLHTLTLHNDSVWDLRVHHGILGTAGLDGTVGIYQLEDSGSVSIKFLLQVMIYRFKIMDKSENGLVLNHSKN